MQALCAQARLGPKDQRQCGVNPSPQIHFHGYGIYGADVSQLPFVGEVKTLRTIMRELGHERVDVLKADIEGSEWSLFADGGELAHMAQVASQVMLELHLNPNQLGEQLAGLGASAPAMPSQSRLSQVIIAHHETFSTTIQPQYSSTKG